MTDTEPAENDEQPKQPSPPQASEEADPGLPNTSQGQRPPYQHEKSKQP